MCACEQVSLHGSGVGNGLFLPAGSAVVEVLCWNFCGPWPDSYFRQAFEGDQSVNSGYFRLVADKEHCFPGEFEKNQTGVGWTGCSWVAPDMQPVLSRSLRYRVQAASQADCRWAGNPSFLYG
jgi:hypothetical protein